VLIAGTAVIGRWGSSSGGAADARPDRDEAALHSLSEVYEGRPYAYSTPEDVPRYRVAITVDKLRTTDIATA
jgi:hypothetical protein